MSTTIERFVPELLPAVQRFSERTWQRPGSDEHYRWRYLDSPLLRGYLAMRDGEVVATLWAFRRPWRVGDRILHFLEVFDWFVAGELRQAGLGVRVLQAAMKESEPCVLIGGREETRSLMRRLKWDVAGETWRYTLPLAGRELAAMVAQRLPLPEAVARAGSSLAVGTWFRPRPQRPSGSRMIPTAGIGEEVARLYDGDLPWGTVPLWPPEQVRWLAAGYAGAGHFVPLYFSRGDELLGWSLLRVFGVDSGLQAEIVELYARDREEGLLTWMVAEVAALARGFGAGVVTTRSACDVVGRALQRNRFRRGQPAPIQVWSNEGLELPRPLLLGGNTNDNPYLPNVERWFESGAPGPAPDAMPRE